MFISVDLPEPDAPMIGDHLARADRERSTPRSACTSLLPDAVDALHADRRASTDRRVAAHAALTLPEAPQRPHRSSWSGTDCVAAVVVPPDVHPAMTCMPSSRPGPVTSVFWPSVSPVRTAHGASLPCSSRCQSTARSDAPERHEPAGGAAAAVAAPGAPLAAARAAGPRPDSPVARARACCPPPLLRRPARVRPPPPRARRALLARPSSPRRLEPQRGVRHLEHVLGLGTRNSTVAVMPGSSLPSGFATATTTV